ncbi:MAG TPA: CopG family transcriptional regulator [Gemmataceae bacterium]|nr:CopG family transcriptional regulator [Gemmataceae bacterium]
MVITLGTDLEAVLKEAARTQGVSPEELVMKTLRERLSRPQPIEPRDDWERRLLAVGSDCGVSLSNEALGSEGLYE